MPLLASQTLRGWLPLILGPLPFMLTKGDIGDLGLPTLGSSYHLDGPVWADRPDDPRWRFPLDSTFAAWVSTTHIQPGFLGSAGFPIKTFSFLPGSGLPCRGTGYAHPAAHFHTVGVKELKDQTGRVGVSWQAFNFGTKQLFFVLCAVDSVLHRSIWVRGLQAELPL